MSRMSKWLALVGALALSFGVQSAVSSSVSADLKVGKSAEVRLPEDVWIGNTLLSSGLYRARCDHQSADSHTMVFTRMAKVNPYSPAASLATKDVARVQCHMHPLYRKNKQTAVYIEKQRDGLVVTKILVRGENVEHRFAD